MLLRGRLLAPERQGHAVVSVENGRINAVTPIPPDAPVPAGALGGPGAVQATIIGGRVAYRRDAGVRVGTLPGIGAASSPNEGARRPARRSIHAGLLAAAGVVPAFPDVPRMRASVTVTR
jgi:hypothetical protein